MKKLRPLNKLEAEAADLMKSLGVKPRTGSVITCFVCSSQFYRRPAIAKRNPKYCSTECMSTAMQTNEPLNCLVCTKEFYCSKSQQELRKRKTCSKECRLKWRKQNGIGTGAQSPFWQGGKAANRVARYCSELKDWRNVVFERDDFTCQMCDVRGTYLEAHHFFRFAYFPDFRYEPNNGFTLCRPCHDKTKKSDRKFQLIPINEKAVAA